MIKFFRDILSKKDKYDEMERTIHHLETKCYNISFRYERAVDQANEARRMLETLKEENKSLKQEVAELTLKLYQLAHYTNGEMHEQ